MNCCSQGSRQICYKGHCGFCHSRHSSRDCPTQSLWAPESHSDTHINTHSAITAACWNFLGLLVMRHLFSVPPIEDSVSSRHTLSDAMCHKTCASGTHIVPRSLHERQKDCEVQHQWWKKLSLCKKTKQTHPWTCIYSYLSHSRYPLCSVQCFSALLVFQIKIPPYCIGTLSVWDYITEQLTKYRCC